MNTKSDDLDINTKNNKPLVIKVPINFDMIFFSEFPAAYKNTNGKYTKYILDMSLTESMPTCAFGMLLQMHEHLGSGKAEIHLNNIKYQLKELLEISSIDHLFHIQER